MASQPNQTNGSWIVQCVFLFGLLMIVVFLLLPEVISRRPPQFISTGYNLKQIGFCLYEYHDQHGKLPPGGVFDNEGQGFHGWQTMILPYNDNRALYESIDLSLRWDDPRNGEAFSTDVDCYQGNRYPKPSPEGYARTHLAANSWLFFENSNFRLDDITDGLPHTIFAGEVVGDYLPWGHPKNWRDAALGINQGDHTFGAPGRDWGYVVMADGSVREMSETTSRDVLKALSTPAGGD